jgi:hypothetical protein
MNYKEQITKSHEKFVLFFVSEEANELSFGGPQQFGFIGCSASSPNKISNTKVLFQLDC